MNKSKTTSRTRASQPTEPGEAQTQAAEPQQPQNVFILHVPRPEDAGTVPDPQVIEVPIAAQIRIDYDQPEPWNAIADWANANSMAESKGIHNTATDADLLIKNSRGEGVFIVTVSRL